MRVDCFRSANESARSKAARIRSGAPLEFEQALFAGLPYTVITDAVRAAGFTGTSVHTVEQAVYRARKYGRAKPTVNRDPRPRFGAPTGLPSQSSQVPRDSMNEDMKRISRRLRELSRPPRPGEPDPLN